MERLNYGKYMDRPIVRQCFDRARANLCKRSFSEQQVFAIQEHRHLDFNGQTSFAR